MRNMTHESFCPVCQEGMWAEFFERVSLIDGVDMGDRNSDGTRDLTLQTLKLGQRREGFRIAGEKLETKWFLNNAEQTEFRDQFTIKATPGTWIAEVHFVTPEVRHDPKNLLTARQTVTVPSQ